jgi:Na+(H+)/acetate symporter ActP
VTLTSVSDILAKTAKAAAEVTKIPWEPDALNAFWISHPLLRILAEQPALWAVPLAIILMIVVSKATRKTIPADVRMKMLVLHAPEALGLKQEYIQEHQGSAH